MILITWLSRPVCCDFILYFRYPKPSGGSCASSLNPPFGYWRPYPQFVLRPLKAILCGPSHSVSVAKYPIYTPDDSTNVKEEGSEVHIYCLKIRWRDQLLYYTVMEGEMMFDIGKFWCSWDANWSMWSWMGNWRISAGYHCTVHTSSVMSDVIATNFVIKLIN